MNYTDSYNCLKELFNAEKTHIKIPWSGIDIFNLNYQSRFPESEFINVEDKKIAKSA